MSNRGSRGNRGSKKQNAPERNPLKTLQRSVNNKILVRLKTGHEYTGRLIETDAYMNLVLSEAEELEDGESIARFGEIFIRGNNILFIKPDITALERGDY